MSKQSAIVTGASSGIGRAISKMLMEEGYEVYGIGRDFQDTNIEDPFFHAVVCNLLDEKMLKDTIQAIPQEHLMLLVNNAGSAWYGPHETLDEKKIRTMSRILLEVPMVLSQYFLRTLKKNKGTIANIVSITAVGTNTHGAAYGALKAGLLSFSRSLFEENRKSGLKVVNVLPDMTDTALYRNADFTADSTEGCSLKPEDTAEALRFMLKAREGTVIESITVRPQFHRIKRK